MPQGVVPLRQFEDAAPKPGDEVELVVVRLDPEEGLYELTRPTAAVNVGIRPTFETGRGLLVEAYLIDYDGDLYGQNLRVAFVGRLRGERRFPSVENLIAQMNRDVAEAREICKRYENRGG